jgi:hypothetical protein
MYAINRTLIYWKVMQEFLSNHGEDEQFEDPANWASELNISFDTLAFAVALPIGPLQVNSMSPEVQTRLKNVHAILYRVRPRFKSLEEAWQWFSSTPVAGFGDLSASGVITQYGDQGIAMVKSHVEHKKLGGFCLMMFL